ncbi:pyridoxamine 5'-phosphate oxidase family protein [Streptomyces libani]|nr:MULTISPECIES: pyridoxamine 5'-phosphate oxidase family protein [Streptomyces]MCW7988893.1 pyridoxamine 5'-phosphate oxidase [Streptomyces platensis subsp. clarensis]AWN26463.1 pyridoxamine 5'-phosphate oxidase family protein [Streptomyces sp. NEAU-S7GS2]MCR8577021.1 pyridoxamine 5'-phosphate oxidase family protein [Streptomyces sp. Isolate_219]MYT13971.1 pyridoxamine 5'-phosphate oxidase family protein [Streptomyces sp. SID4951]MYX10292.1 pyridoxamine 5'-phosphate oxidase family protein [St
METAGAADLTGIVEISSAAELRELFGEPSSHAANKTRHRLHDLDRQWLARSPFCVIATADAQGRCDASPKGDPAGFTHVLDDTTLVIPDRPGNKRVDGWMNVLANPHVGLNYLLPGRGDTLRINGRARLLRDAPFFDALIVKGHRPRLALLVEVEEVFYHCSKAFLRSELWKPETWQPDALPSRARIVKGVEAQDMPLEELEQHYGPRYAERLYG